MGYHVFISYRHQGASELARLLYSKLSDDGYAPFLDLEGMHSGMFNEQIFECIDECSDMLVLLPENAFSRSDDEEDWMRREIAYALKKNKTVVPVMMRGFHWPNHLPEDIAKLNFCHGIEANMEYFDAMYAKICSMLTYHPQAVRKRKRQLVSLLIILLCAAIGAAGRFLVFKQEMPAILPTAAPDPAPAATQTAVLTPEPASTAVPTATPEPDENAIFFGETEEGRIRWLVLSSDEEYTQLISAACIAVRPFGETSDWSSSALRTWLNEDYLYRAFTQSQRQAICAVEGDLIRIPGIDEAAPMSSDPATDEHFRCTYFSKTGFAGASPLLYTISPEGALGVSAPTAELGVRIIIKVQNSLMADMPGTHFALAQNDEPPVSNLSILTDTTDSATFRVRWDGKADELWIFLGQVRVIYIDRAVSGISSFLFDQALPNTTYKVALYSGDTILSDTFTTPRAKWYDRFGAMGSRTLALRWVDQSEVDAGAAPAEAFSIEYQTLSADEFVENMITYQLCSGAIFSFAQESPDHEFAEMLILRTPSGNIAHWKGSNQLSAQTANSEILWLNPLNFLVDQLHWETNTIETGTYTIELYFDNALVAYTDFLIV